MIKRICLSLFAVLVLNCMTLTASAEMVMFNTITLKYHSLSYQWAFKCTVNCIKIDKKEARKRGGVPCRVCGG